MADKSCNVLFRCTGNSARSTRGEAILNRTGKGRFHVYNRSAAFTELPIPPLDRLSLKNRLDAIGKI